MTLQLRITKTDWSVCWHMSVRRAFWLANHHYTFISVFLTGFLYFSHQVACVGLPNCHHEVGWRCSRSYIPSTISRVWQGIEPGTSGVIDTLTVKIREISQIVFYRRKRTSYFNNGSVIFWYEIRDRLNCHYSIAILIAYYFLFSLFCCWYAATWRDGSRTPR